ncbi:MAG: peroxidase-related enzyme [Pseudomonadota bacterium]
MTPLTKFTKAEPKWVPRVTPVKLDEATEAQRDALSVTPSGRKISDYVLVLAHDVETLKIRSPLFNEIMYHEGGLGRADRELGATAASVVNRCIYCAAVHAHRQIQNSGDASVIDAIFKDGPNAELPPREAAVFSAATTLSEAPSEFGAAEVASLAEAGLDAGEQFDLVLSTALFGWANRLMHVLGDPVKKE